MKTMTFGDVLRRLRDSKKLSQRELAERAKLHPNHISQFETGQRLPHYSTLCKIANALGVTLSDLDAK